MTTQNILGEFEKCGFSLREPDDHIAELYFGNKLIARYNQSTLTPEILQEGCQNYLKNVAKYNHLL